MAYRRYYGYGRRYKKRRNYYGYGRYPRQSQYLGRARSRRYRYDEDGESYLSRLGHGIVGVGKRGIQYAYGKYRERQEEKRRMQEAKKELWRKRSERFKGGFSLNPQKEKQEAQKTHGWIGQPIFRKYKVGVDKPNI